MSESKEAKFSIGQVVHHLRFDYRGVIVDVDASYEGTEDRRAAANAASPEKADNRCG